MPKLKENQVPAYRLHKQSGQAVVTLNSRDHLLGKYGSAASKAEYRRLTAEWLAGDGFTNGRPDDDITVSELCLAFWKHAKSYYRDADGSQKNEAANYKAPLRLLREMYGPTRAADFGPLAIKALMHDMVRHRWARSSINRQAARIKSIFKWAVANELVPASVYQALIAVSGFARGRTEARESEPVRPVADADISAVLPFLSRQVKAMVDLQLLTGARPGEICAMRGCDLETGGELWVYRPESHKTRHLGHERIIYLGPKARAIVEQFLKPNPLDYLFSPAEAEAERLAARHAARKTPAGHGNAPGTNRRRKPRRTPGSRYDAAAYRLAIRRACECAFEMPEEYREPRGKKLDEELKLPVEEQSSRRVQRAQKRRAWRHAHTWHPHQLRHNAATKLRKEFGLEAAQVILGHKSLSVTEIYAERNVQKAMQIMGEVG